MKIERLDNGIYVIDDFLTESEEDAISFLLKGALEIQLAKLPPPENIATVTIGPLEIGGNPDDTGDEYGCCTSGSDGYI